MGQPFRFADGSHFGSVLRGWCAVCERPTELVETFHVPGEIIMHWLSVSCHGSTERKGFNWLLIARTPPGALVPEIRKWLDSCFKAENDPELKLLLKYNREGFKPFWS